MRGFRITIMRKSWRKVVRSIVFAVPVAALGLASCEGCRSSPSPDAKAPPLAADAPPSVRLYLLTDVAGALEPCGCTRDQLGGMDHFAAWVKESAKGTAASSTLASPAASGAAPSVIAATMPSFVASAGPLFFMDEAMVPEHAGQDRAKAQTIARVLHGFDFPAFAPGTNDWADGPPTLGKLATASGASILSASSAQDASAPTPLASLVMKRVPTAGGGSLGVAFIGYGQGPTPDPSVNVEDVIRRGAAQARAQGANVLIALVAVGRGEAKRIADAVPDLTAVVVGSAASRGDGNTTAPPGERVGDVLIVQAANHLQSVAVLDLYLRDAPVPGHVVKFADATGLERGHQREEFTRRIDELRVKIAAWERDRTVASSDLDARRHDLTALETERDALDAKPAPSSGSFFRYALKEIRPALGNDPAIEADFLAYYKEVDAHNRVAFADRMPPPHGPNEATYVGIDACSTCHPGPRAVWNGTRHAHAYETLSSQFKEFNLDCVSCHVTGYENARGEHGDPRARTPGRGVRSLSRSRLETRERPARQERGHHHCRALAVGLPRLSSSAPCRRVRSVREDG